MADQSTLSELQNREANQKSKNTRKFWTWAAIIGGLILLVALAIYYYLNRQRDEVVLNVAAGPYRSDSFELMKEISDVVSRQSDFLRIKVVATKDSSQNIALLNAGEKRLDDQRRNGRRDSDVPDIEKIANDKKRENSAGASESVKRAEPSSIPIDLATIRSDTPVVSNVRMVANLFPDYFQIITANNSTIEKVTDLQGARVAIPEFGTDEFRSFWSIADHYGISITSVKWKTMPFQEAANKLLAGELDAVFTVRSLRDRLILNLYKDAALKSQNLKLVEIDQADAISIKRPFLKAITIPKGAYDGAPAIPAEDIISTSVTRNLMSREDIEPFIIHELTRILFENRLDLVIRFSLASAVTRPDLEGGTSVPLHEGSVQYYNRDQPSFLQENAEPIALMLTIAAGLFSGLLAIRSRLMSGQKDRMDSYNYMLLDIADKARHTNDKNALVEMKNEHYSILETVVRALDTDEVTEEGFQSFSLLWESVREVLNERAKDLA